jgi:L-fucose isomerase-like protein
MRLTLSPQFGRCKGAVTVISASCAAGDSQVIADVNAGTHDTFTFD